MEALKTITLPSFLRRTLNVSPLKTMIKGQGGVLKRKGRSRNWFITANITQLQAIVGFIEESDELSWLWLSKHLKKHFQELNHSDLVDLATKQHIFTVSKLMALTDCTIAQARRVMDELEELD